MKFEQIFDKLISFQSISEISNKGIINFIYDYLKNQDLNPKKIQGHEGRFNLYCKIGPDKPGGIILSGHTDVVPVEGQKWSTNPFKLSSANNKFYGRGTCDMKGFIATVLHMVPKIKNIKLAKPIHLVFSYDEEVGCIGIQKLIPFLKKIKPKPKFCIVGEPTEMKLVNRHKGKKSYEVIFKGVECHSSLVNDGVNAIEFSNEFISFTKNFQNKLKKVYLDQDFSPPFPTLNIGKIYGGIALNIVPKECSIEFEIRDTPNLNNKIIKTNIENSLKKIENKMKLKNKKSCIKLINKNNFPPLDTSPDKEIISVCLKSLKSNSTASVSFGTEAGVFDNLDFQTVVCGPGSIKQAHRPNEYIEKNQIIKCEKFLKSILDNLNKC